MQKITSLETLVSSGRMKRPSHTTKTSRVQGIGLFRKCLAIARCLFHDHSGLIYWWTPDATFMDLNPTKLVFPPYNAYEWNERQVYTTAGEETPSSKLISHDLEFLAPDIVKLLGSGTFDINAVNSMMAEQKGSGLSRKKVACNWLKANEERWRPWIPVETACSLGFGLYDETKDRFATLRAGATTCRACLPGTYSMKIVDSVGVTYVCEACPPGQQQRGAGAVVCEPCPLGTSKGYQSIENCAPCQAGKYQDQEGTLMCKDCPNSTTTVLLGVTMLSDCVCKEGTMDVNDAGQSTFAVSKECVECTEGIRCPDGATLKGLQVGQNVTGFSGPAILEGYFSWSKEPLSIYKCPEPFCPGGRPGTCQGGRLGPTCSECAAGMYWANDQCTVCEVPLKVTWFVAIVAAFVLMIAAYYGTDPRYRARATVKECMSIGTDLMLAFVQNLGILSAVQVPWPGELRVLFEFSSIFVLNLKAMGFNCASHGDMQQYVLCAGVFLAVTGTLPTLGALSHFLPSLKRRDLSWNFYKTICVTGKFLQSGFTTLCNIGMVPFMCFLHPNGTHSILKYPNTFCNSSEHWAMQIGGTVVLLLAMTHFIVCAWACHQAPVWSRSTPHRLVGIGFLLANYRPSTWWFGLTLLIRGPLLSFPAVVATNSPGINLTMMFFVLQISFALQLYFLPWKAPILNIVDATATSLFLMLLAISLHLEDANRSLVVLELVGVGVYYVSIGVIACVWFVSLALLAWQRCFAARREPKIVNLGALPDANDVLSAIELVTMSLAQKTDKQKEFLLKKMSFEISAYDLRIVGQALDILFDDCELRPVSQSAAGATARLAAKRMSQMTRRSITYLRPSLQKELEEEAQEVHADTRIVGAAGALEEQPEGVDAEVEVRQVHSFNSSISSFRDDAL
ncbi:unnamed protein product [Durusdinium trenchii]|uniref:Tyrosine-protein kinase ephrin type A/B receptor-like domain-containing protein n=1 Tax=Durusdinium trenchii TaxID=1381693 RepID=A0ABP0HX00_9DINO